MAMLGRQLSTTGLNSLLDGHLSLMHVNAVVENEILVENVAAEVGVDQPPLDRVLLWEHRVLREVLGERIVNGESLLAKADAVGAEGGSHSEPEKVCPRCFEGIFANMKFNCAFWLGGLEIF